MRLSLFDTVIVVVGEDIADVNADAKLRPDFPRDVRLLGGLSRCPSTPQQPHHPST
jgi:hypothetical protein